MGGPRAVRRVTIVAASFVVSLRAMTTRKGKESRSEAKHLMMMVLQQLFKQMMMMMMMVLLMDTIHINSGDGDGGGEASERRSRKVIARLKSIFRLALLG